MLPLTRRHIIKSITLTPLGQSKSRSSTLPSKFYKESQNLYSLIIRMSKSSRSPRTTMRRRLHQPSTSIETRLQPISDSHTSHHHHLTRAALRVCRCGNHRRTSQGRQRRRQRRRKRRKSLGRPSSKGTSTYIYRKYLQLLTKVSSPNHNKEAVTCLHCCS